MSIRVEKDFEIRKLTTFKIGGKIGLVYFPKNSHELIEILEKNHRIPVFGNLSDTLISTDGYDGEIVLTSEMDEIEIAENRVKALCGVKGPKLSQEVQKKGLSGLEFMIGFPGSIGGEVFMNAGANGQCVADNLVNALCYNPKIGLKTYTKDELEFEYRTSVCAKLGLTVIEAEFELEEKDPDRIKFQMDENLKFRKNHQPSLALPNCGSIFKNPIGDSAGRLLESIGAKSLTVGGAHVWRNHSNFIINSGNATSFDVLTLMNELQFRVKDTYNIILEPELKFLGNKNKKENELWQKLNQK